MKDRVSECINDGILALLAVMTNQDRKLHESDFKLGAAR